MNRYLIFRTDRIGDFLITAILLKCIKKNDTNAHITLIASNSNLSYIKTFPYVNQVIPLNNNFSSKLNLFFKLSKFKYKNIIHNDKVAKVSIVGAGMVSTPGITYRMFRGLSEEKINILAISTSEIKLSVIIDEDNTLNAIKKLHTIFDLD